MRIPWLPLLVFLALSICSDVYINKRLVALFKNKIWSKIHIGVSIALYAILALALFMPRKDGDNDMLLCVMWMLYTFLSVYLAKYIIVIVDLLGKLIAGIVKIRNRFFSYLAFTIGLTVFLAMWWGALINRFNIDVNDVEIARNDVPDGFNGYRIVQISDFHTGTYGNDTTFLSKLVNKVNSLNPDLVVFTGDIVNSRSYELTPHVKTLSRLRAKDGVYSIMGNHDYGDYANWESPSQKAESVEYLKLMQKEMGWLMLNNGTEYLRAGNDSIALIGVENIGDHPFPIYGSLTRSYKNLDDSVFKILLTHNPAHWCDSISDNGKLNVALTLSGHTHAMQMEVAGLSPAALRYKTWGGLYADKDSTHLLYVNIGAGTVGFPARIGATPEITVFTLRKSN